ncbi:tetratricopeptide repeat protein [Sporolactobacillus sp. CPB3-1]|uniref:Tetratricopeptide repeat protein n=1 Tax=Sporolactobacillus mangiferae TaxID=2940498 RepID=A0ABT0MBL3_9BACL|nr:tetratricopeptide repeat protein [Sporolactobacillus mangiferae]MCL1632259.1 tetratricopeptide repeat protein [Sporolactobacillus mangiferae]
MQERNRTKKAHVVEFHCDGDFFYQKGLVFLQTGDLDRANKYMDRALKINPTNVEYLCRQAEILAELEHYEASIRLLKKVVYELDATMTDCYFFIANNYTYLGDFREALDEVQTYLTLDPNGSFRHEAKELYQLLSSELSDSEDEEESLCLPLHERGRLALEHGHFEEAVHHFQQVLENEPDFLAAQNNLSIAYFSLGKTDQAIQAVQHVLEKDPGNIHALCNLITFYAQLGDQNEVIRIEKQLNLIYPFYSEHCGKIGSTYLFIGRYERAYYWLREAEKRGVRRDQVFFFWMALAAYHCGDEHVAHQNWSRVDYFSDKPFHPFKYSKIQDMMFEPEAEKNFMVKDLILQAVHGEVQAYRFFALFYAARRHMLLQLQDAAKTGADSEMVLLVNRFIRAHEQGFIDPGLQMMHEVERLVGGEKETLKHPEIFIFWAVVDSIVTEEEPDIHGWAGALIYLWKKEYGASESQKKVAEQAGTSLYRIRKHIHQLSIALERRWADGAQ